MSIEKSSKERVIYMEGFIVLPAIAVRGVIPLPGNDFKIEVGRPNSVLALDAAEKMYDGNVILLVQKDSATVDVTENDVQLIGVLGKVTLKLKLPNGNYKVKFKISSRIEVKEFTSTSPYFVVNYEKLYSILNNDESWTRQTAWAMQLRRETKCIVWLKPTRHSLIIVGNLFSDL